MDSNLYDIIKRVLTIELVWTSAQVFLFAFLIISSKDFILSIVALIKFKYSTIVSIGTEIYYNTGIDFIEGTIISVNRQRVCIESEKKVIYIDTQKFMSNDWVIKNEKSVQKSKEQDKQS